MSETTCLHFLRFVPSALSVPKVFRLQIVCHFPNVSKPYYGPQSQHSTRESVQLHNLHCNSLYAKCAAVDFSYQLWNQTLDLVIQQDRFSTERATAKMKSYGSNSFVTIVLFLIGGIGMLYLIFVCRL